jgi:hypothetical protein
MAARTLEQAGYAYNPFTRNDLFGAPSMLNLGPSTDELVLGADDSALPELAQPGMQLDIVQGSGEEPRSNVEGMARMDASDSLLKLAAFLALLGVAFYY